MIANWEWHTVSVFDWGKPYRNRWVFETVHEAVTKFLSLKHFDQFIYFNHNGLRFIIAFDYEDISNILQNFIIHVHCKTVENRHASIKYMLLPKDVSECVNEFCNICDLFLISEIHES